MIKMKRNFKRLLPCFVVVMLLLGGGFFLQSMKISFAIKTGSYQPSLPSSTFSSIYGSDTINYVGDALGSNNQYSHNFVVPSISDSATPHYLLMKNLETPKKNSETFELVNGNPTTINDKGIQFILNHGYNNFNTVNTVFDIDIKGFKQRSIDRPQIENIIKGPQEAFVENIRTNTAILRRIVNNQNLIIENIEIGELSKTKCALCYMQNIANGDLIAEARYRLNNIKVDSLISTGQLEQLIQDDGTVAVPQVLSTERPDKCVKGLMQGRAVILVNGNPYAMIIPSVLTDFLASPEDSNQSPVFTNFLKFIRFLALIITLLLPGMYIAVTNFHQELFPTELLFSILVARENVPFPIIFELLLMEVSFELIREGGLRTPSAIGSTLGIVGALILGDAAVAANIVSPILIIVICSPLII